jgi:hypothetical protein
MADSQRMTRTGLLIIAAVAVLCAAGGFLLGSASGRASTRTATLASADNRVAPMAIHPSPPVPLIRGDQSALTRRLVAPPDGAEIKSVTPNTVIVPGVDAAAVLQTLGAKAVIGTDWVGVDSVEVRTSLVEFTAVSGANSFVYDLDQVIVAPTASATVTGHFSIRGISACVGADDDNLDPTGRRSSTLLCADGEIAIVLTVLTPGVPDDRSDIAALQRQIDALASVAS